MSNYRTSITNGMIARSLDGKKLGTVYRLEDDVFLIEKGLFFPRDYAVRYEDVQEIRDGEIYIQPDKGAFRDLSDEACLTGSKNTSERIDLNNMPSLNFDANRNNLAGTYAKGTEKEEMRVPLSEEQLSVEHHVRDAGAVRVRKEVITENRQVTVPVKHEEIIVERVPVAPGTPSEGIDASFDEKEIVMNAQEEVIEIHKRPVVREEVRIKKQVTEEQQTANTTVRREEAKIDDRTTKSRKAPIVKEDAPKPRHR